MHKNNLQNTYFLAKNLTERMVMARDGQPHRVCIIRPSIVGAVARTPCPGFIGNSSGFTAAILGAAAGDRSADDLKSSAGCHQAGMTIAVL